EAGADTGRRAPKKEGWARAKPKFEHPKKGFKPRARPEAAAEGERTERPKRAFKPREDQFIDTPRGAGGPRKPAGGKPGFGARAGGRPGPGGKPAGRGPGRPTGPRFGGPRGPRSGG